MYINNTLMDFPKKELPIAFNQVTQIVQAISQSPTEMIAGTQLAVMSLAAQGVVEFQYRDGRKSPVSLFNIIVAESGERKTAVFNQLLKPVLEFQQKHLKGYEENISVYEAELKVWKLTEKTMTKIIRKKQEAGDDSACEQAKLKQHYISKPQPPKRPKLLYSDATPEAIMDGLHESIGTTGLISDEGGVIFNGRVMGNTPRFNQLWDGGCVDVERKGYRQVIDGARFAMLVMTQKNELALFRKKQGVRILGNGFFARCLWSVTTSTQGSRVKQPNAVIDTTALEGFYQRATELLEQTLAGTAPRILRFSPEAEQAFAQYQNQTDKRIQTEKLKHEALPGILSKLPENVARLAALVHFFYESESDDFKGDEIQKITLEHIFPVVEYYYQQVVHILSSTLSTEEEDAGKLYTWLRTGQFCNSTPVAKSEIRRYAPYQLRDGTRLNRALKHLEDTGYLLVRPFKNTNGTVCQMVYFNR